MVDEDLVADAMAILRELIAFPTVTSASDLGLIAYADALLQAAGAITTLSHDLDGRKANLFATIGPLIDEEIGFVGAPILIAQLVGYGPIPEVAIIGEPTSMGVVSGHKGCHEFTTTITGVEGHASAPDRGVNAVEHAVRFVTCLLELGDELVVRAHPDADVHTQVLASADGLDVAPGSAARELLAGLLGTADTEVVAFGTEAGFYQQAGISAVVCGPGSIDVAHQADEYVEVAQLEACLGLLLRLTARLRTRSVR